ncbi:hypothetical protein AMECASPLE_009343, partial [Ameca splendens]
GTLSEEPHQPWLEPPGGLKRSDGYSSPVTPSSSARAAMIHSRCRLEQRCDSSDHGELDSDI